MLVNMEGPEELEFVGPTDDNHAAVTHVISKGKRTKRHRPFSPCAVVAAMTSSSSSVSGEHISAAGDCGSISSTTTTTTQNYDESTEEEEDMANCLILLAQSGDSHKHRPQSQAARTETGGGRRFAEIPAVTTAGAAAKVGLFVYECKTCNRSFPSFQALGGHRASHKKPKLTLEEKKPPPPPQQLINSYEIEEGRPIKSSPQISLHLGNNMNGVASVSKAKIHECSICGSEFTSGQALGGHMRRHRASTTTVGAPPQAGHDEVADDTTTVAAAEVKPKVLALDLNLPAPEEDHQRDSKFEFTGKEKPFVLSAASLVGCHY